MQEIFDHLEKHDSPWVRRHLTYNNVSEEDRKYIIRMTIAKAMDHVNKNDPDELQHADTLLMALVHAGVQPYEIVGEAWNRDR